MDLLLEAEETKTKSDVVTKPQTSLGYKISFSVARIGFAFHW